MPTLPLQRRLIYYYNDSGSNGARYAYFAIIGVVIILTLIFIFRANKRRAKTGMVPIRGTAWMTPPLYHQSQQQNGQPQQGGSYVPQYSATGNANDMGYYQNNGAFVPYLATTLGEANGAPTYGAGGATAPVVSDETGSTLVPQPPPMAHHSQSYRAGNDYSMPEFSRPTGPPPSTAALGELPAYTQPEKPALVSRA